jgi:hypothetical protein
VKNNPEMGDKKHLWVTKILWGFFDNFCRKSAFLFRDFFITFFYQLFQVCLLFHLSLLIYNKNGMYLTQFENKKGSRGKQSRRKQSRRKQSRGKQSRQGAMGTFFGALIYVSFFGAFIFFGVRGVPVF